MHSENRLQCASNLRETLFDRTQRWLPDFSQALGVEVLEVDILAPLANIPSHIEDPLRCSSERIQPNRRAP
jgi:hypothetical protein